MNTIKRNTEIVLDASNQIGLEANAEATKYEFMGCRQKAAQNDNTDLKIARENVVEIKYLGISITNENCIHE
jgi:hypothetical protein